MNDLIPLHFDRFDVRMILRDGVPWWVLVDIAALLNLKNPSKLAGRLEDYQKDTIPSRDSVGRRRNLIVVNEPGIYALTLNSKRPEAKRFAHWLFTEVLPCIRQHGQYPAPVLTVEPEELPLPDSFQADYLTSPATRFFKECIRVLGSDDPAKIAEFLKPLFSASEIRAINNGDSVTAKIAKSREAWSRFNRRGFDEFYIFEGVWQFTPFERGFIDHLRTLPPQHQARLLSSMTRQIAALEQAGEIHLLN